MPVRATGTTRTAALYTWLADQEQREKQLRDRLGLSTPGNARRLAAFAAGLPVDVCASELPQWAREGQPVHLWRRATVNPDGTTEFWDDNGSVWLAEQGL